MPKLIRIIEFTNKMDAQWESLLRQRIRWLTWFFIFGLFLSGATVIPLREKVHWLIRFKS